jgi:hypothetical protein
LLGCDSVEVRRGVDFHHHTDHVFHEDPTFTELESKSRVELERLGVRKGPRRALAHVGLELMLDAILARSPEHVNAYQSALHAGTQSWGVALRGGDERALGTLASVLAARAERLAPKTAFELVDRMARVLERRPALCFDEDEREKVLVWAGETSAEVELRASAWLQALKRKVVESASSAVRH